MKLIVQILLANMFLLFFVMQDSRADVCTPVSKPTKYIFKKGDQMAETLRVFALEPVFGQGGSLEKFLRANSLANQNAIQSGTEVVLPFSCEQQTDGWRMLDRGEDRIITLEKTELKTNSSTTKKSAEEEQKNRAFEIIENDIPVGEQINTESGASEEMSEALRYRMICDGEWTGTECITRYSAVYLLGGAWYNRYDGIDATTGAQGTLLSKLNPELGFGWHNYWFENFRTNLGFSYTSVEIHPEVRERPIEQNKKAVASVFADARYETGPFGFGFGFTQTEKLFYRFNKENIVLFEDGGVVVNAVPIFLMRGSFSYMFHQAGKYRFDVELGLSALQGTATSGYNVSSGSGVDLALTVQHDRVEEYLFGTLKYEKSQQDTQILLQRAQELGIKFGYAWKLKDW